MEFLSAAALGEFAVRDMKDLASVRPNLNSAAVLAKLYNNIGLRALGVNWLMSKECPPAVKGFGFGVRWVDGQPTDEPLIYVYASSADGDPLASLSATLPPQFAALLALLLVRLRERGPDDQGHVGLTPTDEVVLLTTDVPLAPAAPPAPPVDVAVARAQQRPMRGGCSIGNPAVTAGTLGIPVVRDIYDPGAKPRAFFLSNCHVLAADPMNPKKGELTLQPGKVDWGESPRDVIGQLERFVALRGNGIPNYMDAAVTELDDPTKLGDEILGLGKIGWWRAGEDIPIGLRVAKVGRTTGLTFGVVQALGVAYKINYGGGEPLLFVNQILTSHVAGGGDSGSVLIALDERPSVVGLILAGSRDVTLATPIDAIQSKLGVLTASAQWVADKA